MRNNNAMPIGIWALAITAFAIGIAEFIVVGTLPAIANDLNIPLAKTGSLVGLYAFALAIGTPITVLLVSHHQRKFVLLCLVAVFLVGNVLSAISFNYDMLLFGRIVTAIAHGSFFALGATVAAQLAPKNQEGKAIALMFSGLTLAMVIGVPLGSLIGNSMGWRLPFYAVAALSFIALLAIAVWIPLIETDKPSPIKTQLASLKHPKIIGMMCTTILGFGASFATFTFVMPILTDITQFSVQTANLLLIIFGLATLIGNLLGGNLVVKWGWDTTLRRSLVALSVTLVVMALLISYQAPMIVLLFVWGMLAFGISPSVQTGMLATAKKYVPDAIEFASALNISSFNLGITLGETVGSSLVTHNMMSSTPWASMLITLLAQLPLMWVLLKPRQ